MWTDWVLAAVGLIGLLLLVLGLRRLRNARPFTGSVQGLAGVALMAAATAVYFIALNLYGYQRFTHETLVAELNFKQSAPQHFRALFTPEDGTSRVFELTGDEWQLDARVLKLTGFATLIGLDGAYRLDRLSGRYRDLNHERNMARTIHSLRGSEAGLDTWILVQRYQRWLPLVDASYGNAAFLPMADGARFEVHIDATGLIARPINDTAKKTIRDSR